VAASVLPALVYGAGMRLLARKESARPPTTAGPDARSRRQLITPNV